MSGVRMARPARAQFKPAFTVRKLDGKRKKIVHGFDAKGNRTEKEVEVDAGFLVEFPIKKQSIRVSNEAELKRLGFDQTIPMHRDDDSDDDDPVGYADNPLAVAG